MPGVGAVVLAIFPAVTPPPAVAVVALVVVVVAVVVSVVDPAVVIVGFSTRQTFRAEITQL